MSGLGYGLEGKTALVTGGSRGIGFEIAKALIGEGARVAICGRKKEGLDEALGRLGNGDAVAFPAHIAKQEDVEALFSGVMNIFGRLDILINNVGMNLITSSIHETDPSLWQKIIDSNLTGTFLCSRKAGAVMKSQNSGSIVSISSIAGRRAAPAMGIYGIAKAGIEMMTRVLASELAGAGVRVNAVAPGMVRTDFSKPFWSNGDIYNQIVKSIPMGRIAEPADVVHPVLFLCSGGAAFITGQTIMVDGGATAI